MQLALRSPLPVDECLSRIKQAADIKQLSTISLIPFPGGKPFIVEINGNMFRLEKRRLNKRGKWYLLGEVKAEGDGSRVEGNFRIPSIKSYRAWTAFMIILAAAFAIYIYYKGAEWIGVIGIILVAVMWIPIAYSIASSMQSAMREDESYIIELLQQVLVAELIEWHSQAEEFVLFPKSYWPRSN
jgi:hypothetical protein